MRPILLFVILLSSVAFACGDAGSEFETPPPVAARHSELVREINRHYELYYNHAAPDVSDSEYDAIKNELLAIESQHPELVTKESPSQQVGAPVAPDGMNVAHRTRMLSLDKIHDFDVLQSWCEKIEKKLAECGVIACPNTHCSAQLRERLLHFASRDGMRLSGFGPATIDKLLAHDLLHNVADFFILTPPQITYALGLKRVGSAGNEGFPKSVTNLCQSIEAAKERGLAAVLTALAIPQIGATLAAAIAEKYGVMDAVMNASLDDLAATQCGTARAPRTLGKVAAQSLHDFFTQEKNREMIARLADAGVVMEQR